MQGRDTRPHTTDQQPTINYRSNNMKRKYSVQVSKEVNCSSSGHYHASVTIEIKTKNGYSASNRHYDLLNQKLLSHTVGYYNGYPQYVMCEIARQLKAMWDAGDIRVFEYAAHPNGHNTKRYNNLRYHDPHYLQHEINAGARAHDLI